MSKTLKLGIILLSTFILLSALFLLLTYIFSNNDNNEKDTPESSITKTGVITESYDIARPDPKFDNFTYTLPKGASAMKLSLPTSIENLFYNKETGAGPFGLHSGGHPEGLDHVWMEVRKGTPIKSWADGVVERISLEGMKDLGETHVRIKYNDTLTGIHMEVGEIFVKEGNVVKKGQEIGVGMSFGTDVSSAEFALIDTGRTDGVMWYEKEKGVYVSPYDYLNDEDKKALIYAYKKNFIEPYLAGEDMSSTMFFNPYEPYLTNPIKPHTKGKITGAWYLNDKWGESYPNDLMTFIEADNPYIKENKVMAWNDIADGKKTDYSLDGTFEIDYDKRQIKIHNQHIGPYYGIFEIDDSTERAKLTIEYQSGSYPTAFSNKALEYVQRGYKNRRDDALSLGFRDSL